jgi:hypothetical protein
VAAGLLVDRASYAAAFGLAAGVLGLAAVLAAAAREARPSGAAGRALPRRLLKGRPDC